MPSEVPSLETRSAGVSLVTCINFLVTLVAGQSFLSMLCAFKVSSQWRPFPVFTCFKIELSLHCQSGQGMKIPAWLASESSAGRSPC